MQLVEILYRFFNFLNGICFFIMSLIALVSLLKINQFPRNAIGSVIASMFFFLSLTHFIAAIFTTITINDPLDVYIYEIIASFWVSLTAVTYLFIRRNYKLVIKGSDLSQEFLLIIAQQAEELEIWHELETKLSPELLQRLLQEKPYIKPKNKI